MKLYWSSRWGNVFDPELFSEIPFCPTEVNPKHDFKSTAWFIATRDIFDSLNAVSWDSIPDLRKFNSTSKSSISLTRGRYMKGTLALQSYLTFFLLLGFLLISLIIFSFKQWLMLRSKKQLYFFLFDAVLLELNKASCCLATICALVNFFFAWLCMVSFAKLFQYLILRCDWEISCAMLSLIVNPLPFSFWMSDMSHGKWMSHTSRVCFTSPLRFCVVDATF